MSFMFHIMVPIVEKTFGHFEHTLYATINPSVIIGYMVQYKFNHRRNHKKCLYI